MSKSLKILVSGDVEGHFMQLYNRVNSIQRKAGDFDLLLCVGNFFGSDPSSWQPYSTGSKKVPIPTLILGPNEEDHTALYTDLSGGDLCDNVTYLGRRGIYVSSNGLKVAYLSGVEQAASSGVCFSQDDISALTVNATDTEYKGVDILITSPWPRGVAKYGISLEEVETEKVGSEVISQVAIVMKPRYHFCGMEGIFYERQPYRNHQILQEAGEHVTRFISLAKVNNSMKHKYLYAFNVTPMSHMTEEELVKQPPDVTECPYRRNASLLVPSSQKEKSAQFFYDQKVLDGESPGRGKKRSKDQHSGPRKHHPKPTGPCWFCLGSPEVEKHLVVSVGTQCYLALAKGGLTEDHILILPIGHHQSTVSSPDEVIQEIDKYKSSLRKYFKSQGKSVVFYERNYKTQHLQIQAVPLSVDVAAEAKETFQGCALCQNIELHEIPQLSDLKQIVPEGAPYFYTELPSGEKLLHRINKGFPLNFGREVLADQTLLNLPERVDWRNCKISKEEETQHAKEFRAGFQKYDFNLT